MELAEADLVCLQDAADVEGHFDPGFKSRGYAAVGYARRAGSDTGCATWFRTEVPLLAFLFTQLVVRRRVASMVVSLPICDRYEITRGHGRRSPSATCGMWRSERLATTLLCACCTVPPRRFPLFLTLTLILTLTLT